MTTFNKDDVLDMLEKLNFGINEHLNDDSEWYDPFSLSTNTSTEWINFIDTEIWNSDYFEINAPDDEQEPSIADLSLFLFNQLKEIKFVIEKAMDTIIKLNTPTREPNINKSKEIL